MSTTCIAQNKQNVAYNAYFEYDQEYGLHKEKGDYILSVEYNQDTLKWQADKNFSANTCLIEKRTVKYIIALSEDSTKVFYNLADKQLFYLTKWENSFTAYGIGRGSFTVRELVTHMMRLINTGNTEADVISFLSKQGEYDF
ncbi:MAG: hypothetical protein AAGA02_15890 [Bacteroidota bacterium]